MKQILKVALVVYLLSSRKSYYREMAFAHHRPAVHLSYGILFDERSAVATTSINGIYECQRDVANVQLRADERPVDAILYQFYYS